MFVVAVVAVVVIVVVVVVAVVVVGMYWFLFLVPCPYLSTVVCYFVFIVCLHVVCGVCIVCANVSCWLVLGC